RGIVHPVDVMSNEPWSADLLDYLAVHLSDNGYDLKKTLELIVTSHAYQSRCVPLSGEAEGPDYVFRGPVAKRLTAEQFVDGGWRLTGTAPARPAVPFGDRGKEPVRAALVAADALQRTLGRPNREQVVTTRPEELSTLQALELTNGRELAGLLERGAKNFRKAHPGGKPDEGISWLDSSALARAPRGGERKGARELLGSPMTDEGLSDLLWVVLMLPEFQLVR